jgi:hypothetical protein
VALLASRVARVKGRACESCNIAMCLLNSHECHKMIACHTSQHYPSQTQTLEGLTKYEIWISKEALFKGVSTRFGQRSIEKSIENPDFILFILPKSSFGEHKLDSHDDDCTIARRCVRRKHTMLIG